MSEISKGKVGVVVGMRGTRWAGTVQRAKAEIKGFKGAFAIDKNDCNAVAKVSKILRTR